ncbi:MAG: dihydrofolate reductase [bacterium]
MISMIFAIDPNGLIGKGNDLPWNYPQDLQYFKATTLHKTVLMGLATYRSILARIGKPLPERTSVVASLEPFADPRVHVISDLIAYLSEPRSEEVFVIGGKTIYELAFPYADRLYITHVKKAYTGDVFLRNLDFSTFRLVSERDEPELSFCIYERKR